MAGKTTTFVPGRQPSPSHLTTIKLAGRDKHGHQLVEVSCDPGCPITIQRLSKVQSPTLRWRSLSCGHLKKESYLAYHDQNARALSPQIRAAIFEARCKGTRAADIGPRFGIAKPTVDVVVRHRQGELRVHPGFESVRKSVFGNIQYPGPDLACGMLVHEIKWLARDIRQNAEAEAAISMLKAGDAVGAPTLDIAFILLEMKRAEMRKAGRRWFDAWEWSTSVKWQPRKPQASGRLYLDVMFQFECLDLMQAAATTSSRRGLLAWFRETIEVTKRRRKKGRGSRARAAAGVYQPVTANAGLRAAFEPEGTYFPAQCRTPDVMTRRIGDSSHNTQM
jgi:hypothetical protein